MDTVSAPIVHRVMPTRRLHRRSPMGKQLPVPYVAALCLPIYPSLRKPGHMAYLRCGQTWSYAEVTSKPGAPVVMPVCPQKLTGTWRHRVEAING